MLRRCRRCRRHAACLIFRLLRLFEPRCRRRAYFDAMPPLDADYYAAMLRHAMMIIAPCNTTNGSTTGAQRMISIRAASAASMMPPYAIDAFD